MIKFKDENYNIKILMISLVVLAFFCHFLRYAGFSHGFVGFLRTFIYISLNMAWGISIYRRIINPHTRRYLLIVSVLILFWLIIRTVKHNFISNHFLFHVLWYWYYLPILFLPIMLLFISISLGKLDDYRLPRYVMLICVPAAILWIFVLTNDIHELVFIFPDDIASCCNKEYTYNFVYKIIFSWDVSVAAVALIIMYFRFRCVDEKKYIPLFVFVCFITYLVLYAMKVRWIVFGIIDFTPAFCLFCIAMLESCISCGLIQSNSRYKMLFDKGAFNAQIADKNHNVRYASQGSPVISKETMKCAEDKPVNLDKDTLLYSSPIYGGRVYWCEDIKKINLLLETLEKNRRVIEENNKLDEKIYYKKLETLQLKEKKRLYEILRKKIGTQIKMIGEFLAQYDLQEDADKKRILLAKCAIVGGYIKRNGNLLLIFEKSKLADSRELSLCIEESFANLRLLGIECALNIPVGFKIFTEDAILFYDFFEKLIECCIDDLEYLWVVARKSGDCMVFKLEMECRNYVSRLAESEYLDSYEDGVFRFTESLKTVGEEI